MEKAVGGGDLPRANTVPVVSVVADVNIAGCVSRITSKGTNWLTETRSPSNNQRRCCGLQHRCDVLAGVIYDRVETSLPRRDRLPVVSVVAASLDIASCVSGSYISKSMNWLTETRLPSNSQRRRLVLGLGLRVRSRRGPRLQGRCVV